MNVKGPEFNQISRCIPNDHARPTQALDLLEKAGCIDPVRFLDLGCGEGGAVDQARAFFPNVDYTGVDIEESPEVDARSRKDAKFKTYDGVNLPFETETFDIIFSKQVFEHIRHPDRVADEAHRVLKTGGSFIGSMSNLEPYHSYSIFNFTPYGVFRLLEDNGFRIQEMRPGPEGLAVITRQLTMRRLSIGAVYPVIETAARLKGWDVQMRNYLKLRFSGQITFRANKL